MNGLDIVFGVVGLLVGLVVAFIYIKTFSQNLIARSRAESEQIKENAVKEAQNKAKEIELSAKQQQMKLKENFERFP